MLSSYKVTIRDLHTNPSRTVATPPPVEMILEWQELPRLVRTRVQDKQSSKNYFLPLSKVVSSTGPESSGGSPISFSLDARMMHRANMCLLKVSLVLCYISGTAYSVTTFTNNNNNKGKEQPPLPPTLNVSPLGISLVLIKIFHIFLFIYANC